MNWRWAALLPAAIAWQVHLRRAQALPDVSIFLHGTPEAVDAAAERLAAILGPLSVSPQVPDEDGPLVSVTATGEARLP